MAFKELAKIREVGKRVTDLGGFLDFIREQGVVGLAVGFALGGAVSKLVSSLVNDIVNPILGIFLGAAGNLRDYSLTLGPAKILWGDFLATAIDFLVVAFVVYILVRVLKVETKK